MQKFKENKLNDYVKLSIHSNKQELKFYIDYDYENIACWLLSLVLYKRVDLLEIQAPAGLGKIQLDIP